MRRKLSTIKRIIFHCLDTPPTMDVGKLEVTDWHKQRGFSECGYHFIIRLDGTIEQCRPLNIVGAHAKGENLDSIGIATAGGWKNIDTRTDLQIEACHKLAQSLVTVFPQIDTIIGHNDVSDKFCPSYNAKEEYEYLTQNKC